MRTLALALVALALLPACKDPEVDGLKARLDAAEAQIQALQAQLGQQPDQTGMVMSLESRLGALETKVDGVTVPKVPHLVAYAGTAQELDLGPFVDFKHYWSDDVEAYVQMADVAIGFADVDCTGETMLLSPDTTTSFLADPVSGNVIQQTGPLNPVLHPVSWITSDGQCRTGPPLDKGAPFINTGILAKLHGDGWATANLIATVR